MVNPLFQLVRISAFLITSNVVKISFSCLVLFPWAESVWMPCSVKAQFPAAPTLHNPSKFSDWGLAKSLPHFPDPFLP